MSLEDFKFNYSYWYTIDHKFIPIKGNLTQIQIFDGYEILINGKIIKY